MKIIKFLLFILLLNVSLISCNYFKKPQLVKFNGKAQGSTYSVSYYDTENRNFQNEIDSLLNKFNSVFSIYDSSSMISKTNRNESVELNDWFKDVFNTSEHIYKETYGCFDPTVAPLVNAWGFGSKRADNVNQKEIDSLLKFVGFNKIKIKDNIIVKEDKRVMLDFNAIAQGFCSDVIGSFLESKKIRSYIVEIGGEIVTKGEKQDGSLWKVGIEKPAQNADDAQSIFQVANVKNKALSTSGNYRKYIEKNGKRYSHEIDPKTGYPEENNLLSVTVVADKCITADAYATAFMVMGLEKAFTFAQKTPELEAFFIFSDGNKGMQTKATKGFRAMMEE